MQKAEGDALADRLNQALNKIQELKGELVLSRLANGQRQQPETISKNEAGGHLLRNLMGVAKRDRNERSPRSLYI